MRVLILALLCGMAAGQLEMILGQLASGNMDGEQIKTLATQFMPLLPVSEPCKTAITGALDKLTAPVDCVKTSLEFGLSVAAGTSTITAPVCDAGSDLGKCLRTVVLQINPLLKQCGIYDSLTAELKKNDGVQVDFNEIGDKLTSGDLSSVYALADVAGDAVNFTPDQLASTIQKLVEQVPSMFIDTLDNVFCAQDAQNQYCGDYIDLHLSNMLAGNVMNYLNTTYLVGTICEYYQTRPCCLSQLAEFETSFRSKYGFVGLDKLPNISATPLLSDLCTSMGKPVPQQSACEAVALTTQLTQVNADGSVTVPAGSYNAATTAVASLLAAVAVLLAL